MGLPRTWYDPAVWTDIDPLDEREQETVLEGGAKDRHVISQDEGLEQDGTDVARATTNFFVSRSPSAAPAGLGLAAAPEEEPPRQLRRRFSPLPTRGSPALRLEGPQPRLSAEQLAILAERLAAFADFEAKARGPSTDDTSPQPQQQAHTPAPGCGSGIASPSVLNPRTSRESNIAD